MTAEERSRAIHPVAPDGLSIERGTGDNYAGPSLSGFPGGLSITPGDGV
jgi:hypothetical protein